jgi:hypothetical protein
MLEHKQPHQCMVCDQAREEMLPLLDQYICAICEKELVRSTVDDLRYAYYLWRLRAFWNREGNGIYESP